jgi:hypothetical protein
MSVEHQLLGLAEVGAHERHAAVRQLHVCRLDHQWQTLQRDRLVAPVELIRLAWGKTQRHECLGRNPCPFVPPCLDEPVHAVVRAVIAAPAQLLEQPLGRTTLPLRQRRFRFQDLRQNRDPLAELRPRLHAPRVLELGLLPADDFTHLARDTDGVRTISLIGRRCSKKARRIWPIRSTPIIPQMPFPATKGQRNGH